LKFDRLLFRIENLQLGFLGARVLLNFLGEPNTHLHITLLVIEMVGVVNLELLALVTFFIRHLDEFPQLTNQAQIIVLLRIEMYPLDRWRLADHLDSALHLFFILICCSIIFNFVTLWIFMLLLFIILGHYISSGK